MSEAGGNTANTESPGASKPGAVKDRNCPFCGQAFTSSSLGRHLDLYIKERNPKPADGIHDVEAIRKMRGGITRRQPRGSLARRDVSTPGTPTGSTARKSPAPETSVSRPSIPKDGQYVVDQVPKYPFRTAWEITGVINDLPAVNGEPTSPWEENESQQDQGGRQSVQQRAPSRAAQKQQLDARQKLADAVDTARAAELALRELLSSWRAAKQQIEMNSLPFDFDPLALDFPALTLQCLQPPPTLFSSTPHPTSTSWSVQPPEQKQYDALDAYFREEFRKWRVACAAATTTSVEDLTYPPSQTHLAFDVRESIKKAEMTAATLEKQVGEHLQSTYAVWEQLSPQRKSELWSLELARSVGRRQKDVEKIKELQHTTKQENANLKSQINQLNRLQQPREFRIMPPATIPFDESFVSHVLDLGIKGNKGIALNMDDRHSDIATLVSLAIERWKNVIVSSREVGMSAQRPLEQPAATSKPNTAASTPVASFQPRPAPNQQAQPRQVPAAPTTTAANGPSNDSRSTTTTTTATSVSAANDENSDEDADAEMEEDDSFAPINTAVAAAPTQPQPIQNPRTREHAQQNSAQFVLNGTGNGALNIARPIPNMNATSIQGHNQRGHTSMKSDYNAAAQGVGDTNGDPMYMD